MSVNDVVTEFMEKSAGKPEKGENYAVINTHYLIRLMAKEIKELRYELSKK